MEIVYQSRSFEVTPALKAYAEKKIKKIQRFFEKDVVAVYVSMNVQRELQIVDITVQVDGLLLRGEEKSDDMYASIDKAIDKLERQIRKFKTRINRKLRQSKGGNMLVEQEFDDGIGEEDDDQALKIVRTKRFAMKPMSVEEAIMQMDLLGHDFFVFQNAETEEVNVVYRRKEGNYGLIEPEF